MKINGYTLIELVITVSLLVIVLLGGTVIFFRSFRSSGISDSQTSVNNGLKNLDATIEKVVKYGQVVRLVDNSDADIFREECQSLTAGADGGALGKTLVVRDGLGGVASYSLLNDGTVASYSGNTPQTISTSEIVVTKLDFTWICRSGVNDMIKISIEAKSNTKSGESITGNLEKNINLLNSGLN